MLNKYHGFLSICFVLVVISVVPAVGQVYTVTDLGVLSTSTAYSKGYGISPSGQYVTGWAVDASYKWRMWRCSAATDMQVVDTTTQNEGFAVNDSGHIAGQIYNNTYGWFAAYYNGTSLLPVRSGTPVTYWIMGCGYGINSANMMCGVGTWGWSIGSPQTQALICNTTVTNQFYGIGMIPTANATGSSIGYGINEYGKMAGASTYAPGNSKMHAFLWTPNIQNGTSGTMADIHSLADLDQSCAKAINNNDDVVGYCQNQSGENYKKAFRKLASGQMELLPTLPIGFYDPDPLYRASEANGVNNSGVIAGTAGYLNERSACSAVRWVNGAIEDLNHCIDLRSQMLLNEANAINVNGQIVGTGTVNGATHAFLLTPIANPISSPTPSIASISPLGLRSRDLPAVIHVTGSGFTGASVVFCTTTGLVMPFRLTTRYISNTELEADFNSTDSVSILVLNPYPGGGESNWVGYTVAPNQAPVALGDTASTQPDIYVNIDVLANDSDPDGDPLSIAGLSSSFDYPDWNNGRTWQGGWVSVQTVADKLMVNYIPPTGFSGMDTFVYQARDLYGAYSVPVLVTVNVIGNSPPVANDDLATVVRNTTADIDVLKNDTDPDNDVIYIASVGTPDQGGSVSIVTIDDKEKIHYEPALDFLGTEIFTYSIVDGRGGSASATVIISVDLTAPPVAVDDTATTQANVGLYIDVLANDSDPNPGNTQLRITDVGTPTNGGMAYVVSIGGPDMIYYEPAADFAGTETFTYTITDDLDLMASATVTVNVSGILSFLSAYTDPSYVAAGDQMNVWAQVLQGEYPVTSVTADGIELTKQPDSDWWWGMYTAGSTLGWNGIQLVATDSGENTISTWAWYRVLPVVYANSKALRQPIMQNACNNFLFCISGKVTVVDGYRFWLDDGHEPVYVYCAEEHGLTGYTGQVRARGQWFASSDYLYVRHANMVTKLNY